MTLKPSAEAVLNLLCARPEGVTSLDCLRARCGSRLAGRVHELRREGYVIRSAYETTPEGARIVRYFIDRSEPAIAAPLRGRQEAWIA
jgi:hypothetical protein